MQEPATDVKFVPVPSIVQAENEKRNFQKSKKVLTNFDKYGIFLKILHSFTVEKHSTFTQYVASFSFFI